MKRMETASKESLTNIIDEIRKGSYVIPDFQREFDWEPADVVDLLKSVFKDYYVGTLLLWRADRNNIEQLSCESIYGFEGKLNPVHIVLDGQQRLSALHYALFAPKKDYPRRSGRYYFFLRIKEFLEGNIEDAIYYAQGTKKVTELFENREIQYQQKEIPLSVLANDGFDYRDWLDGYVEYWENQGDQNIKIEKDLVKKELKDLLQTYDISYIELDRDIDIAKVCDIFTKINSTGVNLNIFDLLNAILKPKDIQLKKMWREESENFEHIVEAKHLLTTMSILKQVYCSPSFLYYLAPGVKKRIKKEDGNIEEVVLVQDKDEFIALWQQAVEAMKKTLNIISNPRDFGAIDPKFVPYPTMMPILTALEVERKNEKYKDKHAIEKKIRQWYWSSIITKSYSSSSESQMAKDYQEMLRWFANDTVLPKVIEQSNSEINNLRLYDEKSQWSAVYRAVFNIIVMKGALDWMSAEKPEYVNLDDHHIVPRSWGEKTVGKDINSILNRTVISDNTNRKLINDKLPNEYLKKMLEDIGDENTFYKVLESHLLNKKTIDILMRDPFTPSDYKEFIDEREEIILYEMRKMIGNVSTLDKDLVENPNSALNQLEMKLRDFIDEKLVQEKGDYWKTSVQGDIKRNIEDSITRDQNKNPMKKPIHTSREKLNYCDMTHYDLIIRQNWDVFEKYFKNKANVEKHFENIRNFRNTEKHVREKNEIEKKLGEASMLWILEIIDPLSTRSYKM